MGEVLDFREFNRRCANCRRWAPADAGPVGLCGLDDAECNSDFVCGDHRPALADLAAGREGGNPSLTK